MNVIQTRIAPLLLKEMLERLGVMNVITTRTAPLPLHTSLSKKMDLTVFMIQSF